MQGRLVGGGWRGGMAGGIKGLGYITQSDLVFLVIIHEATGADTRSSSCNINRFPDENHRFPVINLQ